MEKINAAITGVHGYVPEKVLTNKDLESMVNTNEEWIKSRTGIEERRILDEVGKGASDLAIPAVLELLKKTNTKPEEVDLLICATVTGDYVFPATANIICDKVGASNAWGFDLNAACSGFLYGLESARRFIESGAYKKVILVGVDKMSSIIDYTDRSTCIIFGDGAGAIMLEPTSEDVGVIDAILKSDGSGKVYLHQKAGGSVLPASHETIDQKLHFVYQEGTSVFKFAVVNMADVSYEVMQRNNLEGKDIDWLVPHQANKRIIDATANRMNLPAERVMLNIQKYGNTTAATIPLCLWNYEQQLKKGDKLILAAFGGGFTWGAIYVKWAYDPS
ncbi:MAG: 3-oxoacyl-[acyl-carrier-protein] synthase-3 [Bacteroidia bacterium]|jgi:3-oxoacyl-[acyl-carrier-protein] synthase-3